jgi:hypothetical protein
MYGYWLELTVSDHNPFRDKIEVPIEAGTDNIAVGGYFILIKELPSLMQLKRQHTFFGWWKGTECLSHICVLRNKRYEREKSELCTRFIGLF